MKDKKLKIILILSFTLAVVAFVLTYESEKQQPEKRQYQYEKKIGSSYRVTEDQVDVHSGPNVSSTVLYTISQDDWVYVGGGTFSSPWYHVIYLQQPDGEGDIDGYIHRKYLESKIEYYNRGVERGVEASNRRVEQYEEKMREQSRKRREEREEFERLYDEARAKRGAGAADTSGEYCGGFEIEPSVVLRNGTLSQEYKYLAEDVEINEKRKVVGVVKKGCWLKILGIIKNVDVPALCASVSGREIRVKMTQVKKKPPFLRRNFENIPECSWS